MRALSAALAVMMTLGLVSGVMGAQSDEALEAAPFQVALEPVASGFEMPVLLVGADDGSDDRYVVEQRGRLMRLRPDGTVDEQPLLDIEERVLFHHERGLLGLAFHPRFEENGRFFVAYQRRRDGATVLSEFTQPRPAEVPTEPSEDQEERPETTPDLVPIERTERVLLLLSQPFTTHKSGMLAFDLDGMLLYGVGDGGSGRDPLGLAQDPGSMLGKLLRLDIDSGWPYAPAVDNGFSGIPGGHAEIHAIGLRNPWRFSVDRRTGHTYIGDVGEGQWEEIDVLPRGSFDVNFGWNAFEGERCLSRPCRLNHHAPAVVYAHTIGDTGHCAVVGGYVYRGSAGSLPDGLYLYGDYCSGTIWAADAKDLLKGRAVPMVVGHVDPGFGQLQAFGEDDAGELYALTSGGHILQVVTAA